MANIKFPNEPAEYRSAREKLLEAEIGLRAQVAALAALRRTLPMGGAVKEDYVFDTIEGGLDGGTEATVRFSDLFAPGKDTLFLYSFMLGRQQKNPCPACTSLIDYLNGGAVHIGERVNVAVCAAAPIAEFRAFARSRGWEGVRLMSSAGNSYNRDYFAENEEGGQMPMANVFVKRDGVVRHFWGTEMLHADLDGHPRHMDQLWPLWNLLDLTPEGRGMDWHPKLAYD